MTLTGSPFPYAIRYCSRCGSMLRLNKLTTVMQCSRPACPHVEPVDGHQESMDGFGRHRIQQDPLL